MTTVSGLIYHDGQFREGSITLEDGITKISGSKAGKAEHSGIIIPVFRNCHTHIGDAAIPRPERGTVEEIVGPPDGYKHRMLARLPEEKLVESMTVCIAGMKKHGTSSFLDFREGGERGVRILARALESRKIDCDIYSRPSSNSYDAAEMNTLLDISTGIGISSVSDWDYSELEKVARETARQGKTLGLHASEVVREDFDSIIELEPKFLVHMIKASDDDLISCAENDIPVVICPRANSFFGLVPPLERMLDAGIEICLGTDNAMLAAPDMFEEMRALRAIAPAGKLSNPELLNIVFNNSRKVLNSNQNIGVEPWGYDGIIVLNRPLDDPFNQVIDSGPGDIRFVWMTCDRQ